MSGLENYQVAVVRGKRRRQLGGGGLEEAARGDRENTRCRQSSREWGSSPQ